MGLIGLMGLMVWGLRGGVKRNAEAGRGNGEEILWI
jgi:hypothetical protein